MTYRETRSGKSLRASLPFFMYKWQFPLKTCQITHTLRCLRTLSFANQTRSCQHKSPKQIPVVFLLLSASSLLVMLPLADSIVGVNKHGALMHICHMITTWSQTKPGKACPALTPTLPLLSPRTCLASNINFAKISSLCRRSQRQTTTT